MQENLFDRLILPFLYNSRYNLMQFSEVANAVKQGNLLKLNDTLEKHEKFFIKCGIFLILEKLKIITYR